MADRRLRDLERAYAAGDVAVLSQIYQIKVRQGRVPIEHLMILSMLGNPHSQQIVVHDFDDEIPYLKDDYSWNIHVLFSRVDTSYGRRTLYDFYLHLLEKIQEKLYEKLDGNSYSNKYKDDVEKKIGYFRSLSSSNMPQIDDLIALMNDIHKTLGHRVELIGKDGRSLDCTELTELALFDIAAKFVYEMFPVTQKKREQATLAVRYIEDHVGDPDELARGRSWLDHGRITFDLRGDAGWCESLYYITMFPRSWSEFLVSLDLVDHNFFSWVAPDGTLPEICDITRNWLEDRVLNA